MGVSGLSPRHLVAFGALAVLPVLWYGVAASLSAGVTAAINVAIVCVMLYVAFGPVEGTHDDAAESAA